MDRKEADRGCRRLAKRRESFPGIKPSENLSSGISFHGGCGRRVRTSGSCLKQAGIYYEKAAEQSAVRMVTLLEPCMILIMAAVVGSIVLSIMLPVFSMYTAML
ncbi:hypothetical protein DW993_08675 [Clostridium sp. AM51-4]|nr:hypothetical protein DW993_08675 [Clostridium sp. AM51-4]